MHDGHVAEPEAGAADPLEQDKQFEEPEEIDAIEYWPAIQRVQVALFGVEYIPAGHEINAQV